MRWTPFKSDFFSWKRHVNLFNSIRKALKYLHVCQALKKKKITNGKSCHPCISQTGKVMGPYNRVVLYVK